MAVSFRDLLKPAAVDDVEAAKRRQALAEAMYQRSMTPNVPQAGGPVQAKYGVGNALVDLANSLAGAWNLKRANEGVRTSENARAAALMDATKQLQGAVPDAQVGEAAAARIKATPDGQLAEPVYGTTESQQKVAGAMGPGGQQALADALLKQSLTRSDPEFQATVGLKQATLDAAAAERAGRREDRDLDRQARLDALREQIAAREQAGKDAADLRRELAAQQAALQRELEAGRSADRRYAVDNRPNPAAAKAEAAAQKQDSAKSQVDDIVATLNSHYDTLDSGGGIVNPEKGALENLRARVASSGVGQTVGGALGTDNQTARDSIKQTRPLLLQAIKNATGMSAQQMNSNVELKLWLEAATDPSLSVKANREALANIQKWIGSGAPMAPTGTAAPTGGRPPLSSFRRP